MITVEIDGVYCKKCGQMHPTLLWHKKYNDYATDEVTRPKIRAAMKHFRPQITDEEVAHAIEENRKYKFYEEKITSAPCAICGEQTYFISKLTGHRTCSDECLYQDAGFKFQKKKERKQNGIQQASGQKQNKRNTAKPKGKSGQTKNKVPSRKERTTSETAAD